MEAFLIATIIASTPLLFATVGEIITEKAGLLNLGVEGLMIIGAVVGFVAGYETEVHGWACWVLLWPGLLGPSFLPSLRSH